MMTIMIEMMMMMMIVAATISTEAAAKEVLGTKMSYFTHFINVFSFGRHAADLAGYLSVFDHTLNTCMLITRSYCNSCNSGNSSAANVP